MKTIGNKYPCCQKSTGLHLDRWDEDAVLERACPKCGTTWIITFETVTLVKVGNQSFRRLNWCRKTSRTENVYQGPIPVEAPEAVEKMIAAKEGEELEITFWLDSEEHGEQFVIDDLYSVATVGSGRHITATGLVLSGTELGCFPNLFEGGPRHFVHLFWRCTQITAQRKLKGVL